MATSRVWFRRLVLGLVGTFIATAAFAGAFPGTRVSYVVRSGYFQAELLARRVPLDKAREREDLSPSVRAGLDIVEDVKAFGSEMGLARTGNYDTIALDFDRKMYNISATPALSFEPRTWWFPVVGRVPYLGFFREEDAIAAGKRLEDEGYEVYRWRIGTYSTLGWFRDPLLPGMVNDSAYDIARLVLHETAHATVWVPGSVAFNETFASFVGDEAAMRYMESRFGADSKELKQAKDDQEDIFLFRRLQHELYGRLNKVYRDKTLSDEEKLAKKAEIMADFPNVTDAAPLHDKEFYAKATRTGVWNNPRLMQFRTYNSGRDAFEALLAANGGDLLKFMYAVKDVAGEGKDPYAAVRAAAGVTPAAAEGAGEEDEGAN